MVIQAEQITDVITHHGEGPVWDDAAARLRLVDMLAGDLLTFDPERGDRAIARRHLGSVVAAWRPRRGGGMVVALERGFALLDHLGRLEAEIPVFEDPRVRLNDGACDPQGRFYCGSMAYDARAGAGALYRLDPDLSVHIVLSGVTISNGLVWSPQGECAYYVDSATGGIDALFFDARSGDLLDRARVVTLHHPIAEPDGLSIDSEGCLWVALWGGNAVHRYTPAGELVDVVAVAARQVSACTFGGRDLGTLYITTSRQGLDAGDDPAAGALFAARPGVRGVPIHRFAG